MVLRPTAARASELPTIQRSARLTNIAGIMNSGTRFAAAAVLLAVVIALCSPTEAEAKLHYNFYKHKCPKAESIIKGVVNEAVKSDSGIVADFVRMHFHDCFIKGCDASILLDSTKKNVAEKDSSINKPSLEGFDVIDTAKAEIEKECRGVVSCADIIAFAARDSLEIASRGKVKYDVPAGRRDGKVSHSASTFKFLPHSTDHLQELIKLFTSKGLTVDEMVTLSGAHTLGVAACSTFQSRLYSYSNTQKQDPLLDPKYAEHLKKLCPGNVSVNLDPVTPEVLDNNYYRNILQHRVLFTSDMSLLDSSKTAAKVHFYAHDQEAFYKDFVKAVVKLGHLDVKTGHHGEVRLNCSRIN